MMRRHFCSTTLPPGSPGGVTTFLHDLPETWVSGAYHRKVEKIMGLSLSINERRSVDAEKEMIPLLSTNEVLPALEIEVMASLLGPYRSCLLPPAVADPNNNNSTGRLPVALVLSMMKSLRYILTVQSADDSLSTLSKSQIVFARRSEGFYSILRKQSLQSKSMSYFLPREETDSSTIGSRYSLADATQRRLSSLLHPAKRYDRIEQHAMNQLLDTNESKIMEDLEKQLKERTDQLISARGSDEWMEILQWLDFALGNGEKDLVAAAVTMLHQEVRSFAPLPKSYDALISSLLDGACIHDVPLLVPFLFEDCGVSFSEVRTIGGGGSPFNLCCRYDSRQTLDALLQHLSSTQSKEQAEGIVVKELPTTTMKGGWDAISYCCAKNHLECLEIIARHGYLPLNLLDLRFGGKIATSSISQVGLQSPFGSHAQPLVPFNGLEIASQCGSCEAFSFLLQHIADSHSMTLREALVNCEDHFDTPVDFFNRNSNDKSTSRSLVHLAAKNKQSSMINLLCNIYPEIIHKVIPGNAGSGFSMRFKGMNVLHFAALVGCPFTIDTCIDQGADIFAKDVKDGNTPAHLLCQSGSADVLRSLLERKSLFFDGSESRTVGDFVRNRNKWGWNLLQMCARHGHADCLFIICTCLQELHHWTRDQVGELLAEADSQGWTTLHHGAALGTIATVQTILNFWSGTFGVDLRVSVLNSASRFNNGRTSEMLIAYITASDTAVVEESPDDSTKPATDDDGTTSDVVVREGSNCEEEDWNELEESIPSGAAAEAAATAGTATNSSVPRSRWPDLGPRGPGGNRPAGRQVRPGVNTSLEAGESDPNYHQPFVVDEED